MYLPIVLLLANSVFIHATLLDLTCEQIKQFVDGHNRRRLSIAKGKIENQPAGNNLNQLIWDEELGEKAAEWAVHNKLEHNPDLGLPSKRFETGENIYLQRSTNPNYVLDLDVSIREWFDEHKNFKFKKLQLNDFKSTIGHYTQMVWAATTYMGCAISQFQDGKWNSFVIVCNYAPSGNRLNHQPYKIRGNKTNGLLCSSSKHNCKHLYGKNCS